MKMKTFEGEFMHNVTLACRQLELGLVEHVLFCNSYQMLVQQGEVKILSGTILLCCRRRD
jgi:hypothetical protein